MSWMTFIFSSWIVLQEVGFRYMWNETAVARRPAIRVYGCRKKREILSQETDLLPDSPITTCTQSILGTTTCDVCATTCRALEMLWIWLLCQTDFTKLFILMKSVKSRAIITVIKLYVSRPRKDFAPSPLLRGCKSKYSFYSFTALRFLSCLHLSRLLFLLQRFTVLPWPWVWWRPLMDASCRWRRGKMQASPKNSRYWNVNQWRAVSHVSVMTCFAVVSSFAYNFAIKFA
jgi:hypothetical protein